MAPAEFLGTIKTQCSFYRKNLEAMVKAAKEFLPREVAFTVPSAGLFMWYRLPEYCNAQRMIDDYAEELKVVLVPGPAFSSTGECENCMRASFSMTDEESIRRGMERFAEMIHREEERKKRA